ncbi:Expansin-B16 [Triticum urartu]|uniref:Expansin n=2 Tax=Triticum TaxID=4564 RepID=A0A9R0Y3L9_TRITD|nr:Expansin-B16 [Triticum urartu]VAI47438.1 unnamed protein product [Triticum turgidum subsp. durum]
MAAGSATSGSCALLVSILSAALLFGVGEAGAVRKAVDPEWHQATATWYGSAEGDGSDGGACGYGTLVDVVPMKARVGAVSPVLFKSGEGCGACYKVRTPCKYRGKNIAFRVVEGSTTFWLSLLVEFEDGDGDIGSMQLKQANSAQWQDMKHIWGATWSLTPGPLVGPFSVRLTTLTTKKTLSAQDVIPRNWTPKATYTSRLNFA